jgi:glycosyltransferase involved in cell wall biosynthesis
MRMEAELDCRFYFGETTEASIKKMDYNVLRHKPVELRYVRLFSHFNWLKGSVGLTFSDFDSYILIGEPYCLSTWCTLVLNRLLGKKTYLWSHGWYGDEGALKTIIKKAFFVLSHGVFLYGQYARKLMIDKAFDPGKLHVIYNSLQYSRQLAIRKKLTRSNIYQNHFGNRNPTVIFIGRIQPKKKLHLLIEALRDARSNNARLFNIMIIGDGSDFERMKALVIESELQQYIWFYGACYDESVNADFIFNSDVCVSPGEIGLTGIHCLMYGTPVITHDKFSDQMPEFEAVVAGKTGDFFEHGSVGSLHQRIQDWFHLYPRKTDAVIMNCFDMVDTRYNPLLQLRIFKKVFGI